jgi:hypothetical protein
MAEGNATAGRRKAIERSQGHPPSVFTPGISVAQTEPKIPCWVENDQTVSTFPVSVANSFNNTKAPLISYPHATQTSTMIGKSPAVKIVFPLSTDHLITLVQFNVLRACITNRHLLSSILSTIKRTPLHECSSAALHVLPAPPLVQSIPPSLQPTVLQRTILHEEWIDVIPHPVWRDNLIKATGTFDEDALWSDTIGGLFEGFPASEVEQRGVVAWSPPWDVSGWEVSEGFWRKWRWSFTGCEDVIEATNKWRKLRGEEPLSFSI